MTDAFETFGREWRALVRDVGESFVAQHMNAAMRLAVALHCAEEEEAERVASVVSAADRRGFLALSAVLRGLLETAVRGHMTFLLPGYTSDNAAQQTKRQQLLLQSLPVPFELRFRQLLEGSWGRLTHAKDTAFALPRATQLDWRVARDDDDKRVMLRLQTSDGRTRTISVPLRQFHELRHSAASVLQEMNEVENHPMMRLAYMEQSSRVAVKSSREAP